MSYIHENAKPFHFKGNRTGCLLIHGFTGCPAEMKLLGNHLKDLGYTVKGIQLKGHGTKVEDMENSTWLDWLGSAEEELHQLMSKCDDVFIIGLSMGGIISLILSSQYDVAGVVSMASPIKITNKMIHFTPVAKYFRKYVPKKSKEISPEVKDYCVHYDKTPVASISHLLKLIRKAKRKLRKISSPILIIQSKDDGTVEHRSAEIIMNKVKSNYKKLVYLKESGHVVTIGKERDKVFKEVENFIEQIIGG